jgi:hypothetical protein
MELTTTGEMAKSSGVKAIIYGAAGCGKTPLVTTAPNPLYIGIEHGQVSLQGTNLPAKAAFTLPAFYEVLKWVCESPDAKVFDTFYFDSISALAQMILDDELNKKSKSGEKVNGQAAYGEMARRVITIIEKLYAIPNKNVVMLAWLNPKPAQAKPYFQGNEIDTRLPHLFDAVLHLGMHDVPDKGIKYSLQCRETEATFARCRFNHCADYEKPDLTYLFNKLNQTK